MGSQATLSDYKNGFTDFNEYINEINNNNALTLPEIHEGYLVNYEEYKKFKNEILSSFNEQQKNSNNNIVIINIPADDKQHVPEKIKTVNIHEALRNIQNNCKYKIINCKLYKLICIQNNEEKNKNKFEYQITSYTTVNPGYIIIKLEKQNEIKFKNNKNNIVDKTTLLEIKGNITNFHNNEVQIPKKVNDINNFQINSPNNSDFIKHLIRNYFFKKEIVLPKNTFQYNNNQAFIVKKVVMERLIIISNMENKIDLLNKNNLLNGITYQNINMFFGNINQFLKKNENSSINNFQQFDQLELIKFSEDEINFELRNIEGQNKLYYINDFEIIDKEFGYFLIQKFNNKIKVLEINYAVKEGKILLIINFNKSFIYEILIPNAKEIFEVKYLIEIINNKFADDQNILNDYIFQIFYSMDLKNFFSLQKPQIINENFSFILHPIKRNINLSINQIENESIHNEVNNKNNIDNNLNNFIPIEPWKLGVAKKNDFPLEDVSNGKLFGSLNENQQPKDISSDSFKKAESFKNLNNNNQFVNHLSNGQMDGNRRTNENKKLKPKTNIKISPKNPEYKEFNKINEDNLIINLTFATKIIRERNNLLDRIKQSNWSNNQQKEEYYLINKNYIKQLYLNFHLEDIHQIMKSFHDNNESKSFDFIKRAVMNDNELKKISTLNKKDIQKTLDSKENSEFHHCNVNNTKTAYLWFYKNCDIINLQLYNILLMFDYNINQKIKAVDCIFNENKIIMLIKDKIINIARYNNEVIVEYIITTNSTNFNNDLKQIFHLIRSEGYNNFMNKYSFSNLIKININDNINNNNNLIQAKIFEITPDGKIKFNPSDKLKVMILLSLFQQNTVESQYLKVYLINPNWLEYYDYKNIKSLMDKNKEKINNLGKLTYDFETALNIIKLLNEEKLKKIDENLETKASLITIHFGCSFDTEPLIKDKMNFCKKFILINENIFNLFQIYFGIRQRDDDIYYIKKEKDEDTIIIKNYNIYIGPTTYNLKNTIVIGIIDKNKSQFNIKHIFYYNYKKEFENELNFFLQCNVKDYIIRKTCLSPQDKKEYFSPIFDNNQIIGNYYKYKEDGDYAKYFIYLEYLNNKILWSLIYLNYNETVINNKFVNKNNQDEELYLINKKVFSEIKKKNGYEKIKHKLNGKIMNILPSKREIYQLIKNFTQDELIYLDNNSNEVIIKDNQFAYEVEKFMICNPNNKEEKFMIYRDFELVDKNLQNILSSKQIPYHILKCSFIENKIIFHYTINKVNNIKNFCVISKIENNKNISNEYLLIFNQDDYYQNYFSQIKSDLNNYTQNKYFVNNVAPIVIGGAYEIGFVIKLKDSPPPPLPPIPPPKDDIEVFPPIPLVITKINQDFPSKPLIGLQNIGATCYMNSTIQCLCNIKLLAEYFKYHNKLIEIVKNDKNEEKLCSAFKRLIENLYPFELSQNYKLYKSKNPNIKIPSKRDLSKNYYEPKKFKETISRMNPLFEGIAANDAKDLVNFLLMTLHDELNRAPKEQENINQANSFQDQSNQSIMLKNFVDNYKKKFMSIISDLFYALNCNVTQCNFCQIKLYNYQIYFFLIFPLEEVRKYKVMNNNNGFMINNFVNNIVDIYDCFDYEKRVTYMTGDNAMYCNYCQRTCSCSMCTYLSTGPEILIIILNRGKGIEFNVKINFYLELNLYNYIELKDTGYNYELFGVITHIGESGMGGHFIAYCKEYWNNQWLKFNDAIVTPVNDFKSEVIDFAMPYLLFYQKKHGN